MRDLLYPTAAELEADARHVAAWNHIATMWIRDCTDEAVGVEEWWESLSDSVKAEYFLKD